MSNIGFRLGRIKGIARTLETSTLFNILLHINFFGPVNLLLGISFHDNLFCGPIHKKENLEREKEKGVYLGFIDSH